MTYKKKLIEITITTVDGNTVTVTDTAQDQKASLALAEIKSGRFVKVENSLIAVSAIVKVDITDLEGAEVERANPYFCEAEGGGGEDVNLTASLMYQIGGSNIDLYDGAETVLDPETNSFTGTFDEWEDVFANYGNYVVTAELICDSSETVELDFEDDTWYGYIGDYEYEFTLGYSDNNHIYFSFTDNTPGSCNAIITATKK